MEYVNKVGKKYLILLIFYYLLILSPIYFNFIQRFFIIGLSSLMLTPYLIKNNPFSMKKGLFLISLPILLYLYLSLYHALIENTYLVLPLFLISIIGFLFAVFIVFKNIINKIILTFCYLIILGISTFFLPNYYNYLLHFRNNNNLSGIYFPIDAVFYNDKGKMINQDSLFKNKITIIDVWVSSCGTCIKGFPVFNDLAIKYQKDKNIQFAVLNVPLIRDNKERVVSYTEKFDFIKLYSNYKCDSILNLKVYPQYLIVGKDKKIHYIGSLHVDKNLFYNNFDNILKKIKND